MRNSFSMLTSLLITIVDNRGKSVPTSCAGFPLIATNCIKHSSIYPTFENIRYVDKVTRENWFRADTKPNDIIFVNKGTPGRVCMVPEPVPFCFAQDMVAFRCDPSKIDYQYLFAVLRSDYMQKKVENFHVGLVIPHFKKGDLGNLLIPRLKTRKEELTVGKLYLTLSKKIECNNRINAELEAMAKTLYDYWFVQFDFPDAYGRPYRYSGGKMVYNATLKREIPEGWRHSTIGEIFKTCLGGTPSRAKDEYWTPGEVNWLSSGENPSTFVVDPDERISNLGLQNSAAKLLPQGTVILSIVRHIRASILGIDAATNQSVVGIVESSTFKHCFIYPYLVREIPRLMALRTGAQQPHINKGVLDESLLALPDESTLEAFTTLAAPLFLQIKNYLQQNRELTQLRDWLLPMLMNGQVTVAQRG